MTVSRALRPGAETFPILTLTAIYYAQFSVIDEPMNDLSLTEKGEEGLENRYESNNQKLLTNGAPDNGGSAAPNTVISVSPRHGGFIWAEFQPVVAVAGQVCFEQLLPRKCAG